MKVRHINEKVLNFPILRQAFSYDCGAVCVQSVLAYYGIEVRESKLFPILFQNKTRNKGVDIRNMTEAFDHFGLTCTLRKGMSIEELTRYIDKGVPVIILLQAWAVNEVENWRRHYTDGHYVVAVGRVDDNVIFEDPALMNRAYLTVDELRERWHGLDDDDRPEPESVGLVVTGAEPEFDIRKITHME